VLSDYQVTIPEIGRIVAEVKPIVILTSNAARDLGDALKRRCLHLHIGFPEPKLESRIIATRVPGIEANLRKHIVSFVHEVRTLDLKKLPSVSETIDWARVMLLLHASALDTDLVRDTLNVLLKYEIDMESVAPQISEMIDKASRAHVPD
jgi:MoxR-like ATPase